MYLFQRIHKCRDFTLLNLVLRKQKYSNKTFGPKLLNNLPENIQYKKINK